MSEGVVEQARRAFDIAEVRYREGISTQLELDNSRLLLVQAQGNRALAARDLEVNKARRGSLARTAARCSLASRPAGRSVGHESQESSDSIRIAGFGRRVFRLRPVCRWAPAARRPSRKSAAAPPPPVVLSAENLATVGLARLESGPVLSGSLAADREATVRAEVSGSVTEIHAEEGQRVERGRGSGAHRRDGSAGARVVVPILRAFREPAGRGRGAQRAPRRGSSRDRRLAAARSRRGAFGGRPGRSGARRRQGAPGAGGRAAGQVDGAGAVCRRGLAARSEGR